MMLQVYRRLQKIMLCLSHDGTNKYLDVLGEGYDQEVCNWKNKIFKVEYKR